MTGPADPAALLERPPADPLELFAAWYAAALETPQIRYAAAVHLATVDEDGHPDGRIVLLEHFDAGGLVFSSDARSPKARHLVLCPSAALTFHWEALECQVRIRGTVEPAGERCAEASFEARPRRSRLTPWASRQSAPHASRSSLEARYRTAEERFADVDEVPRPEHWRSWRLRPRFFELWRARAARLHDRLRYTKRRSGWEWERLDP